MKDNKAVENSKEVIKENEKSDAADFAKVVYGQKYVNAKVDIEKPAGDDQPEFERLEVSGFLVLDVKKKDSVFS